MQTILRVAALSLALVFPLSAHAATINLVANLDGPSANAGVGTGSSGTGIAMMTFDDMTSELSWNIGWEGLTGMPTAMHFHGPAMPDQNGPVEVNVGVAANPMMGSVFLTDMQADDMLAGLWYLNLHTDVFPAGEIRGQVSVVPLPAAVWLFGAAVVGLVGFMRKRAA